MVVSGTSERCGYSCARRVNSLPNIASIDTSRDFFDEDGGEALGSQVLVHAEEVDLGAHDFASVQLHLHGDTCDESKELSALTSSHTNDPASVAIGGHQSPPQERNGVIKAEHGIIILHIIPHEQIVHLVSHFVVIQVEVVPGVLSGKCIGGLADITEILVLNRLVVFLLRHSEIIDRLGYGLTVPELMRLE